MAEQSCLQDKVEEDLSHTLTIPGPSAKMQISPLLLTGLKEGQYMIADKYVDHIYTNSLLQYELMLETAYGRSYN